MNTGRSLIATVTDAESANAALEAFNAIEHSLTSKTELLNLWNANARNRGLFYDKVLKRYTAPPKRAAKQRTVKSAKAKEEKPVETQDAPQDTEAQSDAPVPQGGQ